METYRYKNIVATFKNYYLDGFSEFWCLAKRLRSRIFGNGWEWNKIMKRLLGLFLILTSVSLAAQEYSWEAAVMDGSRRTAVEKGEIKLKKNFNKDKKLKLCLSFTTWKITPGDSYHSWK